MSGIKRSSAFILILFMVSLLFIGCRSADAIQKSGTAVKGSAIQDTAGKASEGKTGRKESVTLSFLCTNENYPESVKSLISDYEKMSGNKIEVQLFPALEYDNIMKTKMLSGEGPDLYRTDSIVLAQFVWPQDWPENLSKRQWVSRLDQASLKLMQWNNGELTGLPIVNNYGVGMMYNKAIFDKLGIKDTPKTWKEFLSVCDTIKKAGIIPVNIQLAIGSEFGTTQLMHQLFANIWKTRGDAEVKELINKICTNKLKFADVPEFEQAFGQMLELKQKGYINEDFISTTFDMTQDKFGKGEVAMNPCGDFILQPMLSKYPDLKVGFFPTPFGDTEGVISMCTGDGLSINAKAKNKKTALEFIDFFASRDEQQKFIDKSLGIGVFSDVKSTNNMISAEIEKYMAKGLCVRELDEAVEVFPELEGRKVVQEMMLGTYNAKQALQEFDKKAGIIAKSKNLPGW